MSRWPLTLRGLGAAALAVACFVAAHAFKITDLLYVSALLTVAVLAGVASLYASRGSETVTRAFHPDVAAVGDEVDVHLSVSVRSALPHAQGRWTDALPDGVELPEDGDGGRRGGRGGGGAYGVFPATGSGAAAARTVELDYTVLARRRGIRPIGPLSIVSTDPFGFARRRRTVGRALRLTVTPAIVELAPLADQPGETGGSMQTASDQLGQGSDNLIPRRYTPGDSMRRIHWRASAHRDQLMVRQEEQETTPEAVVVFDRGAARWADAARRSPGADPAFELAVSACLSAVARLARDGYVVALVDLDSTPLADPVDGVDAAPLTELAIALASVTAEGEPPVASLVTLLAGATTGPLVVVTGALSATDAAALTPLAHHSTLPVLLAVTAPGAAPTAAQTAAQTAAPAAPAALAIAAERGWRTAAASSPDELAAAWSAVTERGVRRARV